MIGRIIEILSVFIVATISRFGYAGIVLLMAIESACIPLPSEIIMPFSGYLVYTFWRDHCLRQSSATCDSDLYSFSRRRRAHEFEKVCDLHLCRFTTLVHWPGVCRRETRQRVGHESDPEDSLSQIRFRDRNRYCSGCGLVDSAAYQTRAR